MYNGRHKLNPDAATMPVVNNDLPVEVNERHKLNPDAATMPGQQ